MRDANGLRLLKRPAIPAAALHFAEAGAVVVNLDIVPLARCQKTAGSGNARCPHGLNIFLAKNGPIARRGEPFH